MPPPPDTVPTPSPPSSFPVVDLAPLLDPDADAATISSTSAAVAAALVDTGCVVVRDPRVGTAGSDAFLDLLQAYFAQPPAALAADVRADLHYQVGG